MIPARDTKNLWVVSMNDDAIIGLPRSVLSEYGETRNISLLGIDINTGMVEKTGKLATLFLTEPLRQKFAHLSEQSNQNIFAMQAVFATHVKDSRNAPEGCVRSGDRLDDSVIESIPHDTIREIATVIIERATGGGRGVTTPFSLPDGYWEGWFDMTRLLAKNAAKIVEQENGTNKVTEGKDQQG